MKEYTGLACKTRGGANPQGKPRVYFCCHPDDLAQTLDPLCADLFEAEECAVYYTEDMTVPIPEETRGTDLSRMNLFVVPVTLKLLTEPCRAMQEDIPFAMREHIPVLPVMMEEGLEAAYRRPDRFGSLQYLKRGEGADSTEIPYREKLKRFVGSVLISSETAERVRAAFDMYIFLSYRKKNRAAANELMRLIHRNPLCRDIAVWYDEYLTPGENFNDEIRQALEKSELFILLVTPDLVKENNYIRSVEYPAARQAGKKILPAEAEETDRDRLRSCFPDLPEVADARDETAFRERLLEAVGRIARQTGDDPVHTYLIGLAYLDGIDVETDRERALELITRAAEADLPEAMEKLLNMYYFGQGVALNYRTAMYWCRKLARYRERTLGEEHPDTLKMYLGVAYLFTEIGEYRKSLEWNERVYEVQRRTLGEEHPDTLVALHNLAISYGKLGDYQREAELCRRVYEVRRRVLGETHAQTLGTLNNLALSLEKVQEYKEALEILEKVYEVVRADRGEEDPTSLIVLNNLAIVYCSTGDNERALALQEKAYALQKRTLGEEHPDALTTLANMVTTLLNLGNAERAMALAEKCYDSMRAVLGEEHPNTLIALSQVSACCSEMQDYEREISLDEKVYEGYRRVLGEEHPDTIGELTRMALACRQIDQYERACELNQKACALWEKVRAEDDPERLMAEGLLVESYLKLGRIREALQTGEPLLPLCREVFGEDGSVTVFMMDMVEGARKMLEDPQED